ncbi:MAG: glycosyltransferase family 4 protein [Pseudomonadota bacterium]
MSDARTGYKIAQIGGRGVPNVSGGVERVLEAIAPRLVARGHDVTVYCAERDGERPRAWRGVTLKYAPSLRTKHFDTLFRSLFATVREIFSDTDIIHFHAAGSAPLALLARLAGKRVVTTIHGRDFQRAKWGAVGKAALQFGEWAAVKLPHATVVVGQDLKETLDAIHDADVTFIANGAELLERRPADIINREYGLGEGDYILYLARLVPEKNAHILIDAYRQLADKGGKKLVIAGPTWHSEDYAERLRTIADGDPNVIFTGEALDQKLDELFSNAYAFVLPSQIEGMSLGLLTAMAYGSCVVVSDIPANANVVGDAGLVVETGSVEALRDGLARLIAEPDLQADYQRRARAHIGAEYDWDRIADRWVGVYDAVAKGRKADLAAPAGASVKDA